MGDTAELVLAVPETARIPDGASFYDGPDDTKCRLIRPDGTRCTATRTRATGLCPAHAGIAPDIATFSEKGNQARKARAAARVSLGISARRAASPLQAGRMRAQMRADELAAAIVDGPLDDPELGSSARQTAAIRAVEVLYPQASLRVDVEMPTEPSDVESMSWEGMQQLASQLLTSADQ